MITNKLKINDSKTEIVFRSPQLKYDLSGLSVNVGESMITQSSKVRDLGVIFDQFLNFDDHITAICRSTHFHIRNIGKIRNLLSYDACSTIIHALISCRLDYCNSILYNVPKSKTDRLQRIQNQCARILTKSPRREHITPVLMKLHWLKIQDRIIYKMLMLTYKSYYNMAPPYLCELIDKKESHVNTRLATDHHQLIMPPISKDCSNTFLERSFIYAAPCEWNKLSEHIRTSNFDCFRKSVKTMLFTQYIKPTTPLTPSAPSSPLFIQLTPTPLIPSAPSNLSLVIASPQHISPTPDDSSTISKLPTSNPQQLSPNPVQ